MVCVCRGTLCAWEARLDWAHLQSLCFQGLQPLYVPTLLTEEVLNFSPISLESLVRPLSDIQQNSNYTFSESGIQVYLENSPQNVGDLFTRHSLAGWIIEICPLWLCLCLEELVGQRRLLCLGKLLLVCHHPLWFLKSCRHWFMQLLSKHGHHFEDVWWTLSQLAGSLVNLQCELSKNCSSVFCVFVLP